MEFWLIWILAGVIFFIIELFTPMLFFLNLAFACLLSAIGAYFGLAFVWQVVIFVIFSVIFLAFLRPFLMKNVTTKDASTGIEGKYIGHNAKTILPTNELDGRITIYGEEWAARNVNKEEIPKDTDVKIVRNEGTIFYVEKI